MKSRPAPASVPDYLSSLEPGQARALKSVLALVRKTVPQGELVISYGIPAFKAGRVFMFCAAFRRHIGIYPPVQGDARLKKDLKPYAKAKGNLSFPLDTPLPMALIARVARALASQYAKELPASAAARQVRRRSIDLDAARAIGGSLPGVKDASGARGVALKVGRQLIACQAIHKSAEPESLMVRLSFDRRDQLLRQDGSTYYLTDHYERHPVVLVRLPKVSRSRLRALLTESSGLVRKEQGIAP